MDTVRQNEERAIESADTLPSAETLLRRLTGSLAHTLNNRLTGVIGSLDLALQGTDDPSLSVHLHRGLACALQAAELVRRMVAFAFRPSVPANVTVLALGQIAENTARRVREQHLPGLSVGMVSTSDGLVHGNAVLMQTALDQLVDNALEAMPEGGTVSLRVEDDTTVVRLSVTDTGGGLPDVTGARLFEPFVTTKCAGHLGLGLVLCRDLVQAQGGTLQLDWESSKGTTAVMTFPIVRHDSLVEGTPTQPALASSSNGDGRKKADTPSRSPATGPLWHVI